MEIKHKKALTVSILCIFVLVLLAGILVPVFVVMSKNPNDYTYSFDAEQSKYDFEVVANLDKVYLSLGSDESVGEGTADIVRMKAFEYHSADNYKGISTNVTNGKVVGEYEIGTKNVIEADRFDPDGYDHLYDKYYLVDKNNNILKGPVYATDIEAVSKEEPSNILVASKKGVLVESDDYIEELGVSNVTINLEISSFFYPNEKYDDKGNLVPVAPPTSNFIEFESNGKTYYFRQDVVSGFSEKIKKFYDLGMQSTVIVYAVSVDNQELFPRNLTYYPWSTKDTILMGLNTSNELGFGYYVAMMEYLASEHSKDSFYNGCINTFVIGNEIDYAKSYNRMEKNQTDFKVYMEEYSRLLRLSNLAVRKYCEDMHVATTFTHAFAKEGYTLWGKQVQCYAPKQMIEFLNAKSKLEGDYDWGIAAHPYCAALCSTSVFEYDTDYFIYHGRMSNDFNTDLLTFSNLEVFDMYLSQEELQFNGVTRSIYLTEGGVSSSGYYGDTSKRDDETEAENMQAGLIAALWYKISQIDSIKCFNYYRLIDCAGDGGEGTKYGLLTADLRKKPSFEVWKYIDTQYSQKVAEKYLKYIKFYDKDHKMQTVENGGITSYLDVFDICGSKYFEGKEFDWEKATPLFADTVEEWENN